MDIAICIFRHFLLRFICLRVVLTVFEFSWFEMNDSALVKSSLRNCALRLKLRVFFFQKNLLFDDYVFWFFFFLVFFVVFFFFLGGGGGGYLREFFFETSPLSVKGCKC